MSNREHAVRELAALIKADLAVSGARTVAEYKSALNEAIASLLSKPRIEVLELSEADKRARKMTVRLHGPRLPG